jgi:hypothetical protein
MLVVVHFEVKPVQEGSPCKFEQNQMKLKEMVKSCFSYLSGSFKGTIHHNIIISLFDQEIGCIPLINSLFLAS